MELVTERGYTINVPLSGGQDDRAFGRIFREILVPKARQFNPDIILVSAGFDTFYADPLGTMAVTEQGFAYMTRVLVDLAGEVCDGRLLVALEGGYNLQGLRDGALAVLAELTGDPGCPGKVDDEALKAIADAAPGMTIVDEVRSIAKRYWNM